MMPVIEVAARQDPPEWALLERMPFAAFNRAALEFAHRYARPNGTPLRHGVRTEGNEVECVSQT